MRDLLATVRSQDKKPNDNKIVSKAHENQPYITIDEEGLEAVLKGEEPKPYVKRIKDFTFRY